ncbi:MAG: DUF1295 domain-containing protein [Bacteroidia bacterium]|nr:DUF1295 domain-containing protein [Bacteroidia bacterium]
MSENKSQNLFLRHNLPILLILLCPPTAILIWYTNEQLGGSFLELGKKFMDDGFFNALWDIWGPVFWGSKTAWAILGIFAAVELVLLKVLPGKKKPGTTTAGGFTPIYRDNGFLAFLASLLLFAGCSWGLGWFSPTILYDHFGELLGALNVFSLLLCVALYFKGRYAPSGPDHGITGNLIFDYYWGTELYPYIGSLNFKHFINCRIAMMSWPLLLVSFAAHQHETFGITNAMIVVVGLQMIYLGKFYLWEIGYMRSMDIQVDRAGFYIIWGIMVWLPSVYTANTHYLAGYNTDIAWPWAVLIFVVGTVSILLNYAADLQRQRFREKDGKVKIWGKDPVAIHASYINDKGEKKQSLLLASGWWGIARHFHYIPEWLGAVCWTLPCMFNHLLPWFYVIFLGILLVHRSVRDEERCSLKYGKFWDDYKKRVPYKILPGVF